MCPPDKLGKWKQKANLHPRKILQISTGKIHRLKAFASKKVNLKTDKTPSLTEPHKSSPPNFSKNNFYTQKIQHFLYNPRA
jgi:hypothetical protein